MRRALFLVLIPLVVGACADTGLRNLQNVSDGPNEFMLQPTNPLQTPASYNDLPPPTPGQANLTDRSAVNEGIVAFGGRPEAAGAGIPASDGALVQHASRLGVAPNIRGELAERDAKFRKRQSRFARFRIAAVDRYNEAYRREALDANDEAARWRRAGARTPSYAPNE